MRKYTCSFVLTLLMITLYGQNNKIAQLDSLIHNAKTDTGRINLQIKKGRLIGDQNRDSGIVMLKNILSQAERVDYYRGRFDIYSWLVYLYISSGDHQNAVTNLKMLEKIVKPTGDSADFAVLFESYGSLYQSIASYDTSNWFYQRALNIYERHGSRNAMAGVYTDLSNNYIYQLNYSTALQYLQKSLKIAEDLKSKYYQCFTLVSMADVNLELGDTVKAEQIYKQVIDLSQQSSLPVMEANATAGLCALYAQQHHWERAYEFAEKTFEITNKTGDKNVTVWAICNAGVALGNLGRFAEAEMMSKKAISMLDSSSASFTKLTVFSSLGTILALENKFGDAIPFLEKSLNGVDEYNEEAANAYAVLYNCYEKTNNYKAALKAYKKFREIQDSATSQTNVKRTTELTLNYEFDKKQALAKAEQDKKDIEAKRIKNQQYLLIAGLGLIVLAVVIIALTQFRNNKQKKKANLLLQRQKEKVEITLSELKSTQSQLIQSEKMASLGELTAGIAHEIQNPLNFVNNFSDVNKELLVEMKDEMSKGNINDANAIANDVIDNEEKINHHGKRAEAIVKGMLQHSQTSTGKKEPTNINALCDEYLRLAYHGLRAKDNSFNAIMKTDFDESIGNINIIPQDIGRVLLNLYNNAFYAVSEKKKQQSENYEPTVSVNTKKVGDKISISVKDNGNGIPQKIVDKIFQPFFTTKPTGQGTGLGLSLSYDIIKAHGGEIKVETKEGEGSEFIIQLAMKEKS